MCRIYKCLAQNLIWVFCKSHKNLGAQDGARIQAIISSIQNYFKKRKTFAPYMFENKEKTPIEKLGEFGLIDHITSAFEIKHKNSLISIGDDAAVIQGLENILISTDLMIENVHFDLMYTPLKHLGYKLVSTNVSDICAMNGLVSHITVSMALSSKFGLEAVEELYAGIKIACDKYNIELIGGDTSAAHSGLTLSATVFGSVDSPEKLVKRSGAKE